MTWEDYDIDGTWEQAELNLKCSGWVRRDCWKENNVIMLGTECWRHFGRDFEADADYYIFDVSSNEPHPYSLTEEDKQATDWDAW